MINIQICTNSKNVFWHLFVLEFLITLNIAYKFIVEDSYLKIDLKY